MTNHAAPLRESTQPDSKVDRRSPFFHPTRKLSKVFASKSIPSDPSHSGPLSRTTGRPSTASSASSHSSSTPSQKKLKSTKATSPEAVSSIVNGMYAYPTTTLTSSFPHQSARQALPTSPLFSNIPGPSAPRSLGSWTSSETKSQYSLTPEKDSSHLNTLAVAETTGLSPVTKLQQAPQDEDTSVASVSNFSTAPSASAASHGSESPPSSSNVSQSSSSSSSTSSTLRVVGRGGSGSRLRLVTPAPENLDPTRLRQDRLPVIRPIGRGGLGSRPKPLGTSLLPTRDVLQPGLVGQEPLLIRPTGRGGLGSRQKPLKNPPILPAIWTKRSSKSLKGKEKQTEPRFVHPIPPRGSWRISDGSMTTISSIHFAGESEHPAYVSPFSPTNHLRRATASGSSSRPRSLSDPSLSSFTFPGPQAVSPSMLDGDKVNGDGDNGIGDDGDDLEYSEEAGHRQRSFNKLTRTLGDIPPDAFGALNDAKPLHVDHAPKLFLDRPVAKVDKTTKPSRRSSLSVTSLSTFFSRPSTRKRDSVASQHSSSTVTDDLHRFPLEDDFSMQLGSRSSSNSFTASGRSPTPESPIMFAPPSPAPVPRSTLQSQGCDASAEPEQEEDTPSVPSPTLSRSISYTPLSRSRSVASHNHSASASLLTFRSESPAFTSNWMIPPSSDDEETVFAVTQHVPEKPQVWTGEWNGDLQDVIKSLRALR